MRLNPFGFILIIIAAFVIWGWWVSDKDDDIPHENHDDIPIRSVQNNESEEKQDNTIAIKDKEGSLSPVTNQDKLQTYTDSVTGNLYS